MKVDYQLVKTIAQELGFQDCGIARARFLQEAHEKYSKSIADGLHAQMKFLERETEKRFDPSSLLPDCKTVIVVSYNYLTEKRQASSLYKFARYTWITDYHILVKDMLEKFANKLLTHYPTIKYRTTTDSSAISEKNWAVESGLGKFGKNGVIHNENGSFFVIGTLLIDKFCDKYDDSSPESDCGECELCVKNCPANALQSPFKVDAKRCISYLNTEDKTPNFSKLASEKYIFGCDICQEVCPKNKKISFNQLNLTKTSLFLPLENSDFEKMDRKDFRRYFSSTSVFRRKFERISRIIEEKKQQNIKRAMNKQDVIEYAAKVLREEAESVSQLVEYLDDNFVKAVESIIRCKGRVIVTGIGKSAIIGQKIVGTFNSTGTPAIFMHAADAVHGDLGMIQREDVVVCISKSGNTPEIALLVPFLKENGNMLIAIVGAMDSKLAKEADCVLNSSVKREASPNNLAPTSSAMAQLAIGDALASTLIKERGFTTEDFAKVHPGGILGRRTRLKVSDLYKFNEIPSVDIEAEMQDVILEISGKRLGVTAVLKNGSLVGAITDGDLRRAIQKHDSIMPLKAVDVMTNNPKTIRENTLAAEALEMMKLHHITNIFVVDDDGKYLGVIHIHDIIKEGIY